MKTAYPNFAADSMYIKPVYNLNKWLEAMRQIYTNVHFGKSFKDSFGAITSNWDTVEVRDFQSWMDYYQSDNQNKYKKAFAASNFYVNDNIPGYFLPNMPKQPVPPPVVVPDITEPVMSAQHAVSEKVSQEEKRKKMEDQRKKIIGRLNAAVKHLTSQEGHLLAGEEFDKLLAAMYELIKQFQTVNKISLSNKLYDDLIIRQANKLSSAGFNRSAGFIVKFAQNNSGTKLDASGPLPLASADTGVAGGNLTNSMPPLGTTAPAVDAMPAKPEEKKKDVLDELFDNLETAGLTDSNLSDEKVKEDENELDNEISLDDDLMVEAQMAQPTMNDAKPTLTPSGPIAAPEAPIAPAVEPNAQEKLEVTLPESEEFPAQSPDKNIDVIIDNALANISIKDVIRKIEDVNAIFQNRTIARELSIIDLMLSTLGLSSYFNNLSEIIQKNHEASNYSISRLSDILMKLRGAISDETINVREFSGEVSPQIEQLQQKLQNEKDREADRKEKRKQIQDEALDNEIQETLAPKQPEELAAPTVQPTEQISNIPAELV